MKRMLVRAIAVSLGMATSEAYAAGIGQLSNGLDLNALQGLASIATTLAFLGGIIAVLAGTFALHRAAQVGTPLSNGASLMALGFFLCASGTIVPSLTGAADNVWKEAALSASAPVVMPTAAPQPMAPVVVPPPPAPPLSTAAKASLAQVRLVRDAVDSLYGQDADDYRGLSVAALVRARLVPSEMLSANLTLVPAAGQFIEVAPSGDGRAYIIHMAGLAVQDCSVLARTAFTSMSDRTCYGGELWWRLGPKGKPQ